MDRKTFLGGSPWAFLSGSLVLSIVVGIVLSALGITPQNFFYQFNMILRRIYDLGFGAFESVFDYLCSAPWWSARLVDCPPAQDGAASRVTARQDIVSRLGLSLERPLTSVASAVERPWRPRVGVEPATSRPRDLGTRVACTRSP